MRLRISPENFEDVLNLVTPLVQKRDTLVRDSIPPNLKLEVTPRFLATGKSYKSLQFFRASKPTISHIVQEMCDAILQSLSCYIKVS